MVFRLGPVTNLAVALAITLLVLCRGDSARHGERRPYFAAAREYPRETVSPAEATLQRLRLNLLP